MEVTKYF